MLLKLYSEQQLDTCDVNIIYQQQLLIESYQISLKNVTHIALIDFPNHTNRGDSAIWHGQMILLQILNIEVVYSCSSVPLDDCSNLSKIEDAFAKYQMENVAIIFNGGGNFGDLYQSVQDTRMNIITAFPQYKIRSFPDSSWFTNASYLKKVKEIYAKHKDLEVVLRDSASYKMIKQHFGSFNKIKMTPDIAMMIGRRSDLRLERRSRFDLFIQARVDKEGGQDHRHLDLWKGLNNILSFDNHQKPISYLVNDWLRIDLTENEKKLTRSRQAFLRFVSGIDFLTQGQLLITDRLHGHILSTLIGQPHILLENGNYMKATNYHRTWFGDACDGIIVELANTTEKAVEHVASWFANKGHFRKRIS